MCSQKKSSTVSTKQNSVLEDTNATVTPVENKEKESKEQNHCPEDQQDDHQEVGDKKKKASKQKWVPLEIDLAKNRGKRERSPRHPHYREKNADGK